MSRIVLTRGETFRFRKQFPMTLEGWVVSADLALPGGIRLPLRVRVIDGSRDALITATPEQTNAWPLDEEFGGLPLRIVAAREGEVAVADQISIHILPGGIA